MSRHWSNYQAQTCIKNTLSGQVRLYLCVGLYSWISPVDCAEDQVGFGEHSLNVFVKSLIIKLSCIQLLHHSVKSGQSTEAVHSNLPLEFWSYFNCSLEVDWSENIPQEWRQFECWGTLGTMGLWNVHIVASKQTNILKLHCDETQRESVKRRKRGNV